MALHLEEEVSRYLEAGNVPADLPEEMARAAALLTLGVGVGEAEGHAPAVVLVCLPATPLCFSSSTASESFT